MRFFLFLSLVVLFLASCACNQRERIQNDEISKLGKYIYRDDNDIHHINSRCIKLIHGKDDKGHEIYAMHLMDTSFFIIENYQYFRVCSRCVSDKEYEHILKISDKNNS